MDGDTVRMVPYSVKPPPANGPDPTHWQPIATKGKDAGHLRSKHTLSHDQHYFDHSGVTKDGGSYHNLEPLVMKGWKARVAALFYQQMFKMRKFRSNLRRPDRSIASQRRDEYGKLVKRLEDEEFEHCVDSVYEAAFTKTAWVGSGDHDFTTCAGICSRVYCSWPYAQLSVWVTSASLNFSSIHWQLLS
jgi:hypothetical protein